MSEAALGKTEEMTEVVFFPSPRPPLLSLDITYPEPAYPLPRLPFSRQLHLESSGVSVWYFKVKYNLP